jgi:hypothetical protein
MYYLVQVRFTHVLLVVDLEAEAAAGVVDQRESKPQGRERDREDDLRSN